MMRCKSSQLKLYHGASDGLVFVTTAKTRKLLNPRFVLRKHSPTGFAWGYCGSGPAQLALALAADVLDDDQRALELYQEFKFRFVANWPRSMPWGPFSADELRLDLAEIQSHWIYKSFC